MTVSTSPNKNSCDTPAPPLRKYLQVESNEWPSNGDTKSVWVGPSHEITDVHNIPSISAIINESAETTKCRIRDQDAATVDQAWRQEMKRQFAAAGVANEHEEFWSTGYSNGRRLRLQVMLLPPGLFFKVHAHPNMEFEWTLRGRLREFRSVGLRADRKDLQGERPLGPELPAMTSFEELIVDQGEFLVNEVGSVHQSFTGTDQGCAILVLWSGCHANIPPWRNHATFSSLRPTVGWEDQDKQD